MTDTQKIDPAVLDIMQRQIIMRMREPDELDKARLSMRKEMEHKRKMEKIRNLDIEDWVKGLERVE